MIDSLANADRLFYLADIVCDERASDSDLAELDAILLADEASRYRYLDYCRMHATLGLDLRAQRAVRQAWQQIDFGVATSFDTDFILTAAPSPAAGATFFPRPGLPLHHPPCHARLFPRGMPLAYLLATVITGLGLLIGSADPRVPSGADGSTIGFSPLSALPSPLRGRPDHRHGRLQVDRVLVFPWGRSLIWLRV